MTTYTFYGVLQPILAAGEYTGNTPKVLEKDRGSRGLAANYGITLENGLKEVESDHQGTILYRKITGIIQAWAQKQATLDILEQDILDVLKAASLSYQITNIGYEISENDYEVDIEMEVIV